MKKLVLIAVLLQLCLSVLDVNAGGGPSAGKAGKPGEAGKAGKAEEPGEPGDEVNENQLQFGDLLVSPFTKLGQTLSHYVVYVGSEHFDGKEDDQNIFEMTDEPAGCRFLTVHGPFRRHNYMDKSKTPQSKQNMIDTIKKLMKKDVCKTYSVTRGNCEQIATYVRYGEASCKQEGTKAAPFAKKIKTPMFKRHDASAAA